jgi:hypothetical protein
MSDSRTPFFERFSQLTDEFRRVVAENLQDALKYPQRNALEAMLEVHRRNREESFLYRLLDRPWLLPLSSVLEGLRAFSEEIENKGIAAASVDLLRKTGVRLKVDLTPQVRSILEKKHPILLAGEHPSYFGFDLFAIAVSLLDFWQDKNEPRLLALAMTTGICPGLQHSVFPIAFPRDRMVQFLARELGNPERLARAWAPEFDRQQALYITNSSLDEMVNYWLGGGHILIFPDGGVKDRHWFFGIGRIILETLRRLDRDSDVDPYILFFCLKGAKDYLILNRPFVSSIQPARLILLGKKKEITIRYQRFLRLRDYQDTFLAMNKTTLTYYLQKEYELTCQLV